MRMSENDYIAEYIKERRPEIIHSLDFIMWKLVKACANAVNELVNAAKDMPLEELEKLCREEDEEDGCREENSDL